MKPLKIAVLGTINQDVIIFPGKKKKTGLGGIAYNIYTLTTLLQNHAEIHPVCNVGANCYPHFVKLFSNFSNLKLNGIKKVPQKHNTCLMYYDKSRNRKEYLQGKVPSLNFAKIKPFLNSDAILINFISGWDMSLEVLKKIREKFEGIILLDLHSLTLGMDKNHKRFLRKPENWEAYVKCCDILQMNKTELETVLDKKIKEKNLKSEAKKILKFGPKIFILTLEKEGAIIGWKTGKKNFLKKIDGVLVKKVVDNTGCGDVFGAAFLSSYLINKNVIKSARLANSLAARKCQFSGVEKIGDFPRLKSNFT